MTGAAFGRRAGALCFTRRGARNREVCPNCAHDERIPDHSGALQRTMKESLCDFAVRISAHFRDAGPRAENPGVGGSIPSLPTRVFSNFRHTEF